MLGLRAADDHERAPQLEPGELLGQIGDRAGTEDDAPRERLVDDGHRDSIPGRRADGERLCAHASLEGGGLTPSCRHKG